MKKIQSFPIENYAEANDFMEKNPPRSTPNQSGLIFHNGRIVLIYDDGKEHHGDRIGFYTHLLEGNREKLWIVEHSIEVTKKEMENIRPKWYTPNMSKTEIKKHLEKEATIKKDKDGKAYIPTEEIDTLLNQITNLENQDRMDKHEFNRLTTEIKAYEKLLADIKKK